MTPPASRPETPAAYRTVMDFTEGVPTSSGLRLGATITRPDTAAPVPALLWYDPYRNAWDGQPGEVALWFAERGYAFVNLHSRGTGNSEGSSCDEYPAQETQDGYDAVEWLAGQPWCSGRVGMLGASYSGFTALQVAALAPPALQAIAPAFFTDRRYTDDCHYKGGCLRGYYDVLTYGLSMVARNALPPHPRAVGERWAALWEQRLRENEPYLLSWLAHPLEDDYWAQGSIAGRCGNITAAAYLIAGWNDGYLNPPLRTFAALRGPRKLLWGPWNHTYPHRSRCGPRVHLLEELLRWWDRWLRDVQNGIEDEPAVTVYVREHEPPDPDRTEIRGRWHSAPLLPETRAAAWYLAPGALLPAAAAGAMPAGRASYPYLPAACRQGGLWDAGVPYCLPGEQSEDDARAVAFTSAPLEDELVLFGRPVLRLTVAASMPVVAIAARLCDVAPDGTSVLVTRGILNGTRRHGMDRAEPLPVDTPTVLELELETTCWRFRAGHRLRLSINGSDFPNVWPTPLPGRVTLLHGGEHAAELQLPVWLQPGVPARLPPPSPWPPSDSGSGRDPAPWRVLHDVLEDRHRFLMATGNEFCVSHRDPARAHARAVSSGTAEWEGCSIRSEATAVLSSDEGAFHLAIALNVTLNGAPYATRHWVRSYPRVLL